MFNRFIGVGPLPPLNSAKGTGLQVPFHCLALGGGLYVLAGMGPGQGTRQRWMI